MIVSSAQEVTLKVISRPNARSHRMSDLLRPEKSGLDESLIQELRPEVQKSVYSHTIPITSRPPKAGLSAVFTAVFFVALNISAWS